MESLRKSKSFRQFMTSIEENETDEEDRELSDQLEEIATHFINIKIDD